MAGELLVTERGNQMGIHALSPSSPSLTTHDAVTVISFVNKSAVPENKVLQYTPFGKAVLLDGIVAQLVDVAGAGELISRFLSQKGEVELSFDIPDENMHLIPPELLAVMPRLIASAVRDAMDTRPYPGVYL